jgi:hypothetical protein
MNPTAGPITRDNAPLRDRTVQAVAIAVLPAQAIGIRIFLASTRLNPVGRAKDRSVVLPSSAADLPPLAAELVAAQFDTVAAAADVCDWPAAAGVPPVPIGVW